MSTVPAAQNTKHGARNTVEWIVILGAAAIAALLIKSFLVQAFYIPSGSMENTLNIGDRVLVNKLSYDLHAIHHGDIVVFNKPAEKPDSAATADSNEANVKYLIKRVIALPGDTIEGRGNQVYVNNRPVSESYLQAGMVTDNLPLTTIPPDKIWVMGDNRINSRDSRVFGAIPEKLVVGRAFVLVWPIGDFSIL